MDVFDDSLGELLKAVLRLVSMSSGCDAAFCYVGGRSDDEVIPGAVVRGSEFRKLPARPAAEVFRDAPSGDWVRVARGAECPSLFACFPDAARFSDGYVLYLQPPGQGPCVCGVGCGPSGTWPEAMPVRLQQLIPALSATVRLHDASIDLLECWARLSTTLREACSVLAAQTHESYAAFRDEATSELERQARRPSEGAAQRPAALHAPSLVLSNRERQIGDLLVAGYAAVNAAAVLGISEHTVRTYVRRLYRKLGVTNRADFVRRYIAVAGAEVVAGTKVDASEPGVQCESVGCNSG